MDKPNCNMAGTDNKTGLIIRRVHKALRLAGKKDEAKKFSSMAQRTASYPGLLDLARSVVNFTYESSSEEEDEVEDDDEDEIDDEDDCDCGCNDYDDDEDEGW